MKGLQSLHAMARTMARPVTRGFLPLEQAYAALLVSVLKYERSGALAPYRAADVLAGAKWTLDTWVDREEDARHVTRYRIKRLVWELVGRLAPYREIMAEAHNINGLAGFPLSENEVTFTVRSYVQQATRHKLKTPGFMAGVMAGRS